MIKYMYHMKFVKTDDIIKIVRNFWFRFYKLRKLQTKLCGPLRSRKNRSTLYDSVSLKGNITYYTLASKSLSIF